MSKKLLGVVAGAHPGAGRESQENPWGSLARQCHLTGTLQANKKLSKEVTSVPKDDSQVCLSHVYV